jgi:hypothetical protein
MSAPLVTFTVGLKHLAPDGRKAGVEFNETERTGVEARELRQLLRAAEALAPSVSYPLVPEIRISAPTGRSVVQLKDGRLNFISWSSATSRGGNPTADQIVAIISGEEVEDDAHPAGSAAPTTGGRSNKANRWLIGGLCGIIIIGANAYTVFNYRKPPGNLLPEYRLLDAEPGKRLLESLAGSYETGSAVGDRRLEITTDGKIVWIKFGTDRTIAEKREYTAQAASTGGFDALFTSRKSIIKVRDRASLVLFGDTYVRVAN